MNFLDQQSYGELVQTAEVICGTSRTALPTQLRCLVSVKALPTNTGTIWLGKAGTVTGATGSDNSTAGWPLAAGQEWTFRPVKDSSTLAIISDGAETDGVIVEFIR